MIQEKIDISSILIYISYYIKILCWDKVEKIGSKFGSKLLLILLYLMHQLSRKFYRNYYYLTLFIKYIEVYLSSEYTTADFVTILF